MAVGGRPRDDDELAAELARWSAEDQVSTAVHERRRAAWLGRQAAGTTQLADLLVALAERGGPVVVQLEDGRSHRGSPVTVGDDVVELRDPDGRRRLIANVAIAAVRTRDRHPVEIGARPARRRTDLATELAAWAEDRPRVLVHRRGSVAPQRGTLLAVSDELLALRLDGDEDGLAYVPLAAVAEVSLPESG
jgi:hypothetical protein